MYSIILLFLIVAIRVFYASPLVSVFMHLHLSLEDIGSRQFTVSDHGVAGTDKHSCCVAQPDAVRKLYSKVSSGGLT